MSETGRRAVFFDRDGVIVKPIVMDGRPRPPHSIAEYNALSGIMPGAREAVEAVKNLGFFALLISNQPDIAYGVISKAEWQWIHDHTKAFPFDDEFICFHRRDAECDCKKPKPGKLFEAAEKHGIDLSRSFVVGDTKDDVGAAKAAGCRSIILNAPYNQASGGDIRIDTLSDLTAALSV